MLIRKENLNKRFEARKASEKSDKILKLIVSKYRDFYNQLYESNDSLDWYTDMCDLFDRYIIKECNPLIRALANYRHDFFSSDRECAAIAKTLVYFGLWPENYHLK